MLDYVVNQLSDHIYQIRDASLTSMFLVTGSEKAVLIDTGIGVKGLKETVASITDLPVTVLLTHGHGDHAGGCREFEDVYMNSADRELVYEHGMDMRVPYLVRMYNMIGELMNVPGTEDIVRTILGEEPGEDYVFTPITEEEATACQVPEPDKNKTFKELTEGMSFDLGDLHIDIIQVPGHTRGTCCMLVREEKTILFGDACNFNTLVAGKESTCISEFKKSLLHLQTFEPLFDKVIYSHGEPFGTGETLEDNIILCDKILSGTDDRVPEVGFSGPGYRAATNTESGFGRADGRYGNIYYSDLTCK